MLTPIASEPVSMPHTNGGGEKTPGVMLMPTPHLVGDLTLARRRDGHTFPGQRSAVAFSFLTTLYDLDEKLFFSGLKGQLSIFLAGQT